MQKHPFRFLIITAIIIVLDQVTKILVRHYMSDMSISVIGDFFKLTHVQNPGGAFSLSFGSGVINKIVFTIAPIIMTFVILIMLRFAKSRYEKISFSLILGGAVGNLIDRLVLGSVTDFFDVEFFNIFGLERWPVFNIADSSIVVSVVILLFYTIFIEGRKKNVS